MGAKGRAAAVVIAIAGLLAVGAASAQAAWRPEPASYGVGSQMNVPVTMADGTVLRADVYYPTDPATGAEAAGRFPVLLTQTPYGKDAGSAASVPGGSQLSGLSGFSPYLVKRGYIDVIADVRGTGGSAGSWGLFDPIQASDGAHLVRWAAALPHADGRVGTLGASYMGINQFLTASKLGRGSPLKAMFPIIAGNELYRDTVTQGGLIDLEFGGFYLGLTGTLNLIQPLLEAFAEQPTNDNVIQVLAQHIGGLLTYHAQTIANLETGGDQRYDGSYWQQRSPVKTLRKVVADRIPAFLVGGWYDLFQRGEPLNYSGLQNALAGRPVGAPMKPGQRASGRYQLLMGPWYHVTAGEGIDLDRIELAWFDRWLKHEPTRIDRTKTPLHLYQLGTGRWLDASRYPLERSSARTLYLQPGGGLGSHRPPASGGSDQLLWTGANSPCGRSTEQWGAGTLELALEAAGGQDPCASDDSSNAGPGVATYTTAPFAKPTVISGPIDASLKLTSNRPETELVATIDDVAPNGHSTPITSGALLGSFRKLDPGRSWRAPDGRPVLPYHPFTRGSQRPVPTGKPVRYDVEVFPTYAQLGRGHRLRLRISTSDVPHLAPIASEAANLVGGVYQLHHERANASFLEVPTAPASAITTRCSICR